MTAKWIVGPREHILQSKVQFKVPLSWCYFILISYRTILDISLAEGGDRSSIVPFVLSHDADHDRLMQVARPSRPDGRQGGTRSPHHILVDMLTLFQSGRGSILCPQHYC